MISQFLIWSKMPFRQNVRFSCLMENVQFCFGNSLIKPSAIKDCLFEIRSLLIWTHKICFLIIFVYDITFVNFETKMGHSRPLFLSINNEVDVHFWLGKMHTLNEIPTTPFRVNHDFPNQGQTHTKAVWLKLFLLILDGNKSVFCHTCL